MSSLLLRLAIPTLGSLGVLALLPPLLRRILRLLPSRAMGQDWKSRVGRRYQAISTYVWIFAMCKMRLDPLFGELYAFVTSQTGIRKVMDIGCGYGVPGCAMLEWLPDVQVYGLDPAPARVKVASTVFASRGKALIQGAPDITSAEFPDRFDLIVILDVIHFLPDEALVSTLQKSHEALREGGHLLIRAVMAPRGKGTISWQIEMVRQRLKRETAFYRSADDIRDLIARAGFEIERQAVSGGNHEMMWHVARRASASPAQATASSTSGTAASPAEAPQQCAR